MTDKPRPGFTLWLPPLDGATAAWLLGFCGHLQSVLWRQYGDAIEAHWSATEPDQLIYGRIQPDPPSKR